MTTSREALQGRMMRRHKRWTRRQRKLARDLIEKELIPDAERKGQTRVADLLRKKLQEEGYAD